MGGRSEPDNDNASRRVPESWDRPTPVLLFSERRSLLCGDLLTPLHQTWAAPTPGDGLGETSQLLGATHSIGTDRLRRSPIGARCEKDFG